MIENQSFKIGSMEAIIQSKNFSNAQLELLKLFADDVPEKDLEVLKEILFRFKAERLMDMADRIFEEKGWTDEDIHRMLHTKMRASKVDYMIDDYMIT